MDTSVTQDEKTPKLDGTNRGLIQPLLMGVWVKNFRQLARRKHLAREEQYIRKNTRVETHFPAMIFAMVTKATLTREDIALLFAFATLSKTLKHAIMSHILSIFPPFTAPHGSQESSSVNNVAPRKLLSQIKHRPRSTSKHLTVKREFRAPAHDLYTLSCV